MEGLGDQPVIPGEGLNSLSLRNNMLTSACMEAISKALVSTFIEFIIIFPP